MLASLPVYYWDLVQGTPEWHLERIKIVTASEVEKVIVRSGDLTGLRTLARRKAGEILLGEPDPGGFEGNRHTERGHVLEPQARLKYSIRNDVELTSCGFVRRGRFGYSPDSLVHDDGCLECKSHEPHILIGMIDQGLKDKKWCPPQHKPQLQGALLATGREWIDLEAFWPGMASFSRRFYRDEKYIAFMAERIDAFNEEVDGYVARTRAGCYV